MSKEMKPTVKELQQRVEDIGKTAEKYKEQLEENVRNNPLKSVAMFLVGGIALGVLLGITIRRRR